MNKARPKHLHVLVHLNTQDSPEEFYKITEVRENQQWNLYELYRGQEIVGSFSKLTVDRLEMKADG